VLKTLRSGLHLKTAASPVPFKGVGRTKVLISLDASMGTREAGIRVRREGKKREEEEEEEEEEKKKRKSCRQVFINRFQVTDFRESLSRCPKIYNFLVLEIRHPAKPNLGEGREGRTERDDGGGGGSTPKTKGRRVRKNAAIALIFSPHEMYLFSLMCDEVNMV
jgi:hypothetical protein